MEAQYYKYQHNICPSQDDMTPTCLRTSRARLSNTCCSSISSCCARCISKVAPIAPSCGAPERRNQPTDMLLNFANHRGTKNQRRKYSTLYRYMRPATCNKTLWNLTHHILQSLESLTLDVVHSILKVINNWYQKQHTHTSNYNMEKTSISLL
jgi:hypothetical protein